MKKGLISILSCLLLMMALSGCKTGDCGIISYYMGIQYEFEDCDIRVDLDENEEEFVFDYVDKDPDSSLLFEFSFDYKNFTHLHNSPEFDYVDDDGHELVFNEKGYCRFFGDQIIHISYHHANDEIKSAIASKTFSISFGSGSFKVLKKL